MSVGRAAVRLGVAGLLPQVGAVALLATGARWASVVALLYAALILSFLGGMWWGFAMRRAPGRQAGLVTTAVMPSLTAFAIVCLALLSGRHAAGLVALGISVLLTLPVDRGLAAAGDAPANWMRLRVPLSIGLGALTIAAGWLAG